MRFCQWVDDGGKNSGVKGFFLIEIKSLFTIVLLRFSKGTRDAYHTHAFNAITLWLKGAVLEHLKGGATTCYMPLEFKYTSRSCFHKVEALKTTWALSFRGPWVNTWQEDHNGKVVTLTYGRREVDANH
jgi:hypothetical protein